MNQFTNLLINPTLMKGIEIKQFTEMTDVQEAVIPLALNNQDVIAQAPTGTGKTLAFAIPILEKIDENNPAVQAIILSPTRELAVQITEEIKEVSQFMKGIKTVAIYGGEHIERQFTALKRKPQIVVATPGRLMDHMRRNTIKLTEVMMVVLDESDEMLNMGFKEDIDTILATIETPHQTMLFSATLSKEIERIARTYLKKPELVKISKNELTVSSIEQRYIDVFEKDKIEVMARVIDLYGYKLIMVFCNTKKMVDEVTSQLLQRGFMVEALHGDMKQMQRDRVMQRFRSGSINILVASDVAARGLDVDDVDVVFNYDVPTDEEYYVHRIGRTGRAKKQGLSITLVTRSERYRLRSIISYAKASISKMDIPSLENVMNVRIGRLLKEANERANADFKYEKILNKTIAKFQQQEVSLEKMVQGLILMQLANADYEVDIQEVKEEIETRQHRRSGSSKDTRVFITLGKKDQIKIYHLTDLVSRIASIPNRDINKVELHDSFSFFEIPSHRVPELLDLFADAKYKGRKVNVEIANQKDQGRGKRRRK